MIHRIEHIPEHLREWYAAVYRGMTSYRYRNVIAGNELYCLVRAYDPLGLVTYEVLRLGMDLDSYGRPRTKVWEIMGRLTTGHKAQLKLRYGLEVEKLPKRYTEDYKGFHIEEARRPNGRSVIRVTEMSGDLKRVYTSPEYTWWNPIQDGYILTARNQVDFLLKQREKFSQGAPKDFKRLFEEEAEFSRKTFPQMTEYRDVLTHLGKELTEAVESGEIEEFVDMQLLLIAAVNLRYPKMTPKLFLQACFEKLEINKGRKWEMTEDGHGKHIE